MHTRGEVILCSDWSRCFLLFLIWVQFWCEVKCDPESAASVWSSFTADSPRQLFFSPLTKNDSLPNIHDVTFASQSWPLMPFGFSLSDALDQILSEYAIVHPVKTDANGRVLPTSASTHHHHHTGQDTPTPRSKSRSKRGTLADSFHETLSDQSRGRSYMDREAGLYYNISLFGHDLHLQLRPNSRLVAPTATVEWWEESGDRHSQPIGDTDCFYTGQVSNMEDTSVAISNCDGMVGAIFCVTSPSLPSTHSLPLDQVT